ncbi:MAG: N-acetyl-gamma-glutamyl-phosphate reductase [Gammaproteobacteria bacterium]|nr:N-acetyl-gamma-glutamyl-phosphate reductase [Gammaproteobacteria bacterium]
MSTPMAAGTSRIPTLILGGSGYVAGEVLRLVLGHPGLELAAIMSESHAGQPVAGIFPHLRGMAGHLAFASRDEALERLSPGRMLLLSAAPHGASAALIAGFIGKAGERGTQLTAVDMSADFRFARATDYEAVYRQPHGAPELLDQFASALPEHLAATDRPHIGHPGCFATGMLLAAVPLLKLGIAEDDLFAVGITGSTGAGRTPTPTTHHPERQSNVFAYQPLVHRHGPEVIGLCEQASGRRPRLHFVPQSGPFARGIHLVMQARLKGAGSADTLRQQLQDFYAGAEFVTVVDGMPRLKDIVGSNHCHIGLGVNAGSVAVVVVEDNLVKGAAGGALQWANRKLGLPESMGLDAPGMAWA